MKWEVFHKVLVKPFREQSKENLPRAELLASLLLFYSFALAILLIINFIHFESSSRETAVQSLLGGLGFTFFSYLLSRVPLIRLACYFLTFGNIGGIGYAVLARPNSEMIGAAMCWLALNALICGFVLQVRETVFIIASTSLLYLVVRPSVEGLNISFFYSNFIFFLTTSMLTLLAFRLRDRDAAKAKKSQALMISSSKLASLGEMAGGVAHEVNNPMAIIMMEVEMLEESIQEGELNQTAILETLNTIKETVVRVSKIINGLRSFAREGQKDPTQKVPVLSIIEDTLGFCRERFRKHGIEFELKVQNPKDKPLEIECRPVEISQVI
ncbi:MAG: histidine kinase dimerization/phospho-acceptor domain-containing protein [Bdellovibrionia bacterium]